MKIPTTFKCAGFTIKVEIVDFLPGNCYGIFYDAPLVLKLARKINTEDYGVVTLTEDQMINTFWHEVMHCWQYFYNTEYNEAQAQVYANFMCEFLNTNEVDLPF